MKTKLTPQPAGTRLQARVCVVCGKPKGTICFRQDTADGGCIYAHLGCLRRWRQRQAERRA